MLVSGGADSGATPQPSSVGACTSLPHGVKTPSVGTCIELIVPRKSCSPGMFVDQGTPSVVPSDP
jgi:hypothetical protein